LINQLIDDSRCFGQLEKKMSASEFRSAWKPLVAATYGTGASGVAILTYTSGVFYPALDDAIGISRFQFGLAFTFGTVGLALATPVAGMLMDRFGSRVPIIGGILLLALSLSIVGLFTTSVYTFIGLTALVGILASPTGPVGYTREVSRHFFQNRGLALGIAQAGAGLSGAVLPVIVAAMIGAFDWRAGYFLLAAIALSALPGVVATFRTDERISAGTSAPASPMGPIFRSHVYQVQLVAFALLSLGTSGLALHFVPMLLEMGSDLTTAASWASLIGISIIGSRIGAGWLADRFDAPLICFGICLFGLCGAAIFGAETMSLAPLGALFIGCVIGAEIDLLSFMTARFFPAGSYGRAYAWQYFGVALASGASPALIGFLADESGGYTLSLIVSACLCATSAGLFILLQQLTRRGKTVASHA
jgi:MFS family permease